MRLNQAKGLAIAAGLQLKPFTTRINIAGSIRREKQDVKDIEIVCLPKYIDGAQGGLFSDVPPTKVISPNFVAAVNKLGRVIKGKPDGRYMQIELPQRINLDLFMPDPVDYFRQYAIRTGSADYAHCTIAKAWLKKGWCGSDQGLRLQADCRYEATADGKGKWTCINPNGERPPVWNSEEEFFAWIGVPWCHPKARTI